jgi:hypothetical protein
MKPIALSKQAKEAMRRAGRARIWAGVWRANGFSQRTISAPATRQYE